MLQPKVRLTRDPVSASVKGCMRHAASASALLAQDLLCNVAEANGEWEGVGVGK